MGEQFSLLHVPIIEVKVIAGMSLLPENKVEHGIETNMQMTRNEHTVTKACK